MHYLVLTYIFKMYFSADINIFNYRDPAIVNTKICEHFEDPKLNTDTTDDTEDTDVDPDVSELYKLFSDANLCLLMNGFKIQIYLLCTQIEPDETAFVRFTPNSPMTDSDYANEVYNPPLSPGEDPIAYLMAKGKDYFLLL